MVLTGPTADDPERFLLLRRKLELKQQRLDAIKHFGLAYYRPHVKQDAFHRAGATFKRRMVRAGNRFGKSIMGCAEDCAWLMNERPWYAESDPVRRAGIPQHPVKLLTITTDWDKVDEIFTSQRGEKGKAWKFLPSSFVKSSRRNHSGAIDTIECANGSVWRFDTVKSFKANPQGSESSDWDAIHIDEPCPEDMFTAAARGLIDRGGSAWFTLTPLSEFWINDYFFPEDTRGKPRAAVWAETGTIYDNPYLSKEAISEFETLLSPEERQCRLLGIPLHLSGLIYKEFSWDKHVLVEPPVGWSGWQPPKDYTHYFYIDPHPQTPHAVLFCAVSPFGTRFYYRDVFRHCSIEELASLIRAEVGDRFVAGARIDPLAYINDPITETNMAMELAKYGVFVEKATKAREQGILRVQFELKTEAAIRFSPDCRRTLWEIQRYCWDEKENKPIDKDDHMMENLYRCELSDPKWVELDQASNRPVEAIVIDRSELELADLEYS